MHPSRAMPCRCCISNQMPHSHIVALLRAVQLALQPYLSLFFPPSQNSLCKVAVRNSPTHLVWPQLLPSLQLPPAERTEPANAVMAISHLYSFAFQEEMKDKGEPQRCAPVFPPKYIYLANSHLCLQSTSNNGSYIIIELWYSFRLLTALR